VSVLLACESLVSMSPNVSVDPSRMFLAFFETSDWTRIGNAGSTIA
jgi:hypothetical protein